MALIFDIETNGLIPELDRVHCIMAYDTEAKYHAEYDPDNELIEEGINAIEQADCIIGHNIVGFDIPAIQKVYSSFLPTGRIIDTYKIKIDLELGYVCFTSSFPFSCEEWRAVVIKTTKGCFLINIYYCEII